MLSWVLKRGLESATGATEAPAGTSPQRWLDPQRSGTCDATLTANCVPADVGDTTQLDQPDTPAPVFAARAFKYALFGTPARPDDDANDHDNRMKGFKDKESRKPESKTELARSPVKPNGILLTPGTGTARRKRVSFGHDVRDDAAKAAVPASAADTVSDKLPGSPLATKGDKAPRQRPRSTVGIALENAGKERTKATASAPSKTQGKADDEWEEEPDGEASEQDVTIDLNEPHSRSGKYWKSEFDKYHEDAKVEMGKLVKYKELARSYAKKKDAEAIAMSQRLKDEQAKVARMEQKLSQLASQLAAEKAKGSEVDSSATLKDLARQTALAVEYRNQVKELEALLKDAGVDADARKRRQRQAASPRTQQTLLDTQRELRRARRQIQEIGALKEEMERTKSALLFAEQRASKLAEENKKLAEEGTRQCNKIQDLERELKSVLEENRLKDEALKTSKEAYERLKSSSKAKQAEAADGLAKKNDKIAELREEISTLKAEVRSLRSDVKGKGVESEAADEGSRKSQKLMDDMGADIENLLRREETLELGDERRRLRRQSFPETSSPAPLVRDRPMLNKALQPIASLNAHLNRRPTRAGAGSSAAATTSTSRPLSEIRSRPTRNWREFVSRDQWVPSPERQYPDMPTSAEERFAIYDSSPAVMTRTAAATVATDGGSRGREQERDRDRDRQTDMAAVRHALGSLDSSGVFAASNVSRSSAMPDARRAAAKARLEQRRRMRTNDVANKENVNP